MTKAAKTAGSGAADDQIDNDLDTGGAGDASDADDTTTTTTTRKTAPAGVSQAAFDRVSNDMHAFKKAAKDAQEKLKAIETEKLTKNNEFKTLYEQEKNAREAAEKTSKDLKDSFINEKKYSAVKAQAMAAGLKPEALDDLDMIDFTDVVVETTSTGKTNVLGVEAQIKKLQAAKPHWFGGKTTPKINSGNPRVIEGAEGGDKITVEQVRKAEKEAKKTGDMKPYYNLINRYRAQSGRRTDPSVGIR